MSDEERITFRATTRLADALDAWVAKKRGHAADKAAEIAADDWQQWGRTRDDARREKLEAIRRLLEEG